MAAGFHVEDGVCTLGAVRLRLVAREGRSGLLGWSLRGLNSLELDGLPTGPSAEASPGAVAPHPNGASAVDHVVAFSPDLDRTVAALRAAGLELRRVREEPTPAGAPRQAFFRVGEPILEVIQAPPGSPMIAQPDGPARLWGLALVAADLERTAAVLGDRLRPPREAVQPGRRIATVRREAGLAIPLAFMTPRGPQP